MERLHLLQLVVAWQLKLAPTWAGWFTGASRNESAAVVAVPLPNYSADAGLEQRRLQVAQRKAQRQKRSLELLQGSLSAKRV